MGCPRAEGRRDAGGRRCRDLSRLFWLLTLCSACAHAPARAREPGSVVELPSVVLTATESIGDAGGLLQLLPVASPFDVAVTPDGSQRYRTRLTVHGLPDPASLGAFRAYVAWVVSWYVEDSQRLGVVADGAHEMAEVRWNKFRVLITAESSPDVREPTGPVVLRGVSPSGRLMPSAYCNLSVMGLC